MLQHTVPAFSPLQEDRGQLCKKNKLKTPTNIYKVLILVLKGTLTRDNMLSDNIMLAADNMSSTDSMLSDSMLSAGKMF
jgi:hypothetical protein